MMFVEVDGMMLLHLSSFLNLYTTLLLQWDTFTDWRGGGGVNPLDPFTKTQKLFENNKFKFSVFSNYLYNIHIPHFKLKTGLLYLLPQSSGILPKCLILPIPDKIYIKAYFQSLDFNILKLVLKRM